MRRPSGRGVRREAGTAAADGAWVAPQEDPLDGRAAGDAHEVGLGVVQITQDLVDVIGVHRGSCRTAGRSTDGPGRTGRCRATRANRSGRECQAVQRVRLASAAPLDEHQVPADVQIQQVRQLNDCHAFALAAMPSLRSARNCFQCPGGRHGSAARAHALNRGACASIAVVVSSSRKPPDWCSHSLA